MFGIRLHKVVGDSMSPTYQNQDFVLSLSPRWLFRKLRAGDVVVFTHPILGVLIKRIADIGDDGAFMMAGDNPSSSTSQAIGAIDRSAIFGRVVAHVSKGKKPKGKRSKNKN